MGQHFEMPSRGNQARVNESFRWVWGEQTRVIQWPLSPRFLLWWFSIVPHWGEFSFISAIGGNWYNLEGVISTEFYNFVKWLINVRRKLLVCYLLLHEWTINLFFFPRNVFKSWKCRIGSPVADDEFFTVQGRFTWSLFPWRRQEASVKTFHLYSATSLI